MFYWNEDILLARHEQEIADDKQREEWEANRAAEQYEAWLRQTGWTWSDCAGWIRPSDTPSRFQRVLDDLVGCRRACHTGIGSETSCEHCCPGNKAQMDATLEQLLWALAGAKRECGRAYSFHDRYPTAAEPCPVCGGTGYAYVLPDSVRELCPCLEWPDRACDACLEYGVLTHGHSPGGFCTRCRGLGYVPSRSLEVWLDASRAVCLIELRTYPDGYRAALPTSAPCQILHYGSSAWEALLRALAAGLEAQGVKLEVKDEGK